MYIYQLLNQLPMSVRSVTFSSIISIFAGVSLINGYIKEYQVLYNSWIEYYYNSIC